MDPVVVIGAGVSGLAAAWSLHTRGIPVRVVEADDQVGGVVRSARLDDGTVLDLGPQTLSTKDPELQETLRQVGLGARTLTADPASGRRFVVHEGKVVELPSGPLSLARTSLLSTGAKFRLLGEPFRKGGAQPAGGPGESGEESIADFIRRRLGPEVLDHMVDPFVSGVFAGDPEQISVAAALPELHALEQEHGSIIRGGVKRIQAARKEQKEREAAGGTPEERPRNQIISFDEGLQSWPQAVAEALDEPVLVSTRVVGLERDEGDEGGWTVRLSQADRGTEETLRAGAVILAVPAEVAARLLADLDTEVARALSAIPYAPVSVVHVIHPMDRVDHSLDGFGVLAPSGEDRGILGSLWPNAIFPGRNPQGQAVIANFVGGARTPERAMAEEEEILDMVRRELGDLLGLRGDPAHQRVTRWPRAIPQYTRGHLERIREVARFEEATPGVRLVGSWRDAVSLGGCWATGARVGTEVARTRG